MKSSWSLTVSCFSYSLTPFLCPVTTNLVSWAAARVLASRSRISGIRTHVSSPALWLGLGPETAPLDYSALPLFRAVRAVEPNPRVSEWLADLKGHPCCSANPGQLPAPHIFAGHHDVANFEFPCSTNKLIEAKTRAGPLRRAPFSCDSARLGSLSKGAYTRRENVTSIWSENWNIFIYITTFLFNIWELICKTFS